MQRLEIECSDTESEDEDVEVSALLVPVTRKRSRKIKILLFLLAGSVLALVIIGSRLNIQDNVDDIDDLYLVDSTFLELDCKELVSDADYFLRHTLLKRMKDSEHRCLENSECFCPDPAMPSEYDEKKEWWDRTRQRNSFLLQPFEHVMDALDVLLVGDSLTERWQGTYFSRVPMPDSYGRGRYHPIKDVFAERFGARGETSVKGVPLGVGEDGYSQLLYRIQNDELKGDGIVAPVVWLTVGVYDIQKRDCTPEAVLSGIMEIVQAILAHRHQPTRVVINSILPVTRRQTLARQVNELLHCYAEATPHVEFFDATALFMEPNDVLHRNVTLFQDAIHPNVEGYKLWGRAIVQRVKRILDDMKVEILDWKTADGP
ncbi:hypothetical protein FisN_19Lh220 [Fistulifera solaris]|uniref:SGNH hydrolase-type esterase domain-containing protein n=1 Tax=Fistulifera solaris TaxID=1519565 RepID=A0A1Z5J705_FISSO|nr:hypothetical protein FisN_19Lh220 [Fistulifera solaris]|eukprot:GAX09750.1 hypothetical protein FisN_19Lh220 [Fistulifera solaris]